ncbi:MAG: DUF1549 domain-containing protein [Tepidisphaeraceae bacterium]
MKRLLHRPDVVPLTGTLPPGDVQFRVLPADPEAAKRLRVRPDATGEGAAPDKKASEVLENLQKYDAIYESGFSASGTEMGRDLLNHDTGASLDVTRRWKLTCDDNRFGYTADVTDHEKTPGRKSIRTKTWGYWGQDLSGHYFEDTLFDVNREGKETELGKDLHTSLYGPKDARINSYKYVFLYGLGRFFSKDLAKITRVEETKDGLLVVSALGTSSRITMVPFSSGRWELEIEPAAAWIVRKARFYSDAEPQSTWAGVWTEMTNSGTVWSGPYCIPKEASINCQGPIAKTSETKRLTFDPVVGKFDEKLYGAVRQAVGYNKEPTLTVFDNRVSPETVTEPNRPRPAAPAVNAEPKDGKSRPLFENWKSSARTDGKIPGGRIGEMAASLKTYMDLNPGHEQSVKLEPLLKKCDASRDWTPVEAAALLDEIAAITPQAEWALRTNTERMIRPGKPLPDELANAPWGKPAENGLRIAWLLEPRTETQPLDSVLKSRVLFHNTGKAPVCFATEDWIQTGGHKAKDANGKDIRVWALSRMGIRLRMNFRLAPGEYAEVAGHGLGVGSHETSTEKSIYKVGCWIEAKEGDAVTFTPGSVLVSFQTWRNNEGRKDSVTVWREMIAARVMQESPMPAAAADREQLLRRVTKDLLGTAPTAGEVAAFVADDAPDALARLIKAMQTRAGAMHFAGELSGGETKFRVTPAAPKKDDPKPGAQLKPATEQKLKWGEPANGLRMALAWPPSFGEPGMGAGPEFHLVVQNVSQAEVRLTANDAAPNPRSLILRNNRSPISAIGDPSPMPGDWLLQPRQVAFLRLFQAEKMNDGRTFSAIEEETVRIYPQYSVTAEMSIEKAPAGAWTGKLATGETRGSVDVIPPKHKDAQALYKSWTTAARRDGKLPGALIGQLAQSVKTYIKGNPTWVTTPQLEKMLPRFDAAHDWNGQDAVGLLDELAAVQDTPIGMALDHEKQGIIRTGTPLLPELADAPWGAALPNGLRHAWLLEPRAAEHRLGTPLRARVLIHNAGKEPVIFRTRSWHQLEHKATDAKGAAITVESTLRNDRYQVTRGQLTLFRLAPDEFIEVNAPGIGVGSVGREDNWQNINVGSWVQAKAGDEVIVTTGPLPLSDWNEKPELLEGVPRWWIDHIKARLSRHLPFPADAEARLRLLHCVAMEVLGTSVSKEMNDAFVADTTPAALDSVAKRLAHFTDLTPYTGELQSGPTKFRVLPADPNAATTPHAANNPGQYALSDGATLVVTRRVAGERIVNEASIHFHPPEPIAPVCKIELPDGDNTWAVAWVYGGKALWLQQKSGIRSYDFTSPAQVKETTLDAPASLETVPRPILDALHAALDVPSAPKPAAEPPKPPAATPK